MLKCYMDTTIERSFTRSMTYQSYPLDHQKACSFESYVYWSVSKQSLATTLAGDLESRSRLIFSTEQVSGKLASFIIQHNIFNASLYFSPISGVQYFNINGSK